MSPSNGAIRSRRVRGRAGAQRSRQHRAAGRRDRRRAWRAAPSRSSMSTTARRTRTDGRTARPDGAAAVAAADPTRAILRPVGGGAHRRGGGARADRGDARRRRPERSRLHPGAGRALETGAPRLGLVAGQRIGRKASGFKKLQSRIANARARRRAQGWHPRYRMRPEGVPPRCVLVAALFRRSAPLPAGAGAARRLRIGYVDVVDRPRRHGVSNYGLWDRLWVGILDLAGVWWLIRRKKRVPQSEEVTLAR